MTTDPSQHLPVAHAAADLARDLIRTSHPGTFTEKADRDLVSDVDVNVERAVRQHLNQATPESASSARKKAAPTTPAPAGSGHSTPSTAPPTTPTASRCAPPPSHCSVTGTRPGRHRRPVHG